jgi:hypothetical protein
MDKVPSIRVRVIEAGWLVLATGVPLCFVPWSQNAFELPKAVLLWMVIAIMGATWLAQGRRPAQEAGQGRPDRTWQPALLVGLVCLVAVLVLAATVGAQVSGNHDLWWHVLAGGGGGGRQRFVRHAQHPGSDGCGLCQRRQIRDERWILE